MLLRILLVILAGKWNSLIIKAISRLKHSNQFSYKLRGSSQIKFQLWNSNRSEILLRSMLVIFITQAPKLAECLRIFSMELNMLGISINSFIDMGKANCKS